MSPSLAYSSDVPQAPAPLSETLAARVQRLQAEAKAGAREHVLVALLSMSVAREHAAAIAEGGEAYPPGVRDLCRRFAEDAEVRAANIEALNGRT